VEKAEMDKTQKPLTIEEKLELVRSRAVRFGLKRHDLEDAVQEVAMYLLEFTPDPAKTNGASESTILTGAIDLRLKQLLRTKHRYQDMVDRCGAMLPSEDELLVDGGYESSDLAMDVATILSQLTDFEQRVGRMLTEGHTITSITRELNVGRQCVEDAVAAIRLRLVEEGIGDEVQE
jgi:DNA-binding NarL/FixJ family response regulator